MRSSRARSSVQHVLLEVLHQRAAGAVHHALRQAGRPRGVHDVKRMIEGQPLEAQLAGTRSRVLLPVDRAPDRVDRFAREVRHQHDALDLGNAVHDLPHPPEAVDVLAGVAIRRSGDEDLRAIWPNRSSTPLTPKSGEQLDQIAPRLVAASIATTASGMLGRKPATRSPRVTPSDRKAAASPATSFHSSLYDVVLCLPCSFQNSSAGRSSRKRNRFSAKFRRDATNHRGPNSGSGGATRFPPTRTSSHGSRPGDDSATIPVNCHAAVQNASRSATDH